MFKFGIYTIDKLKKMRSSVGICGIQNPVSITLYEKIQNEPDVEILAEKVLLPFSDARGVYKRTYARRFEKFDQQVVSALQNVFINEKNLKVFDAGISDGRTAVDFFRKLDENFAITQYFATDYDPEIFVYESPKITVTFNSKGVPLEILYAPFVFYPRQSKIFKILYFGNWCIWIYVKLFLLTAIQNQFKEKKLPLKNILLFCPQALALAKSESRFQLKKHDLLNPVQGKVQIFRAMNVLNPTYFSQMQIHQVIENIFNALEDGGVFITGSNQNAGTVVDGGIYQKTNDGFTLLESSGQGSVFHEEIVGYRQ